MNDRETIDHGDWWCVVDFDDTFEPSIIILRIGKKGSVRGQDFVLRSCARDAHKAYEKFNEIQSTQAPTTLRELIYALDERINSMSSGAAYPIIDEVNHE